MSRSARQWSDYRAHIKLLEGDLNECHKWYGVALIRLKFLLEHQPGSVTDAMTPANGVYIRVDTKPNRIHIKVEERGVYVETGFLDLLSSAECAEQTYLPAVLKYNTAVQNYVAATSTPLQGRVTIDEANTGLAEYPFTGEALANNSESRAVGCTTRLPTVNPCGTEYTAGGYCDPAKILMKKKCQALIPASMYSGKLRLFIQAVYGSTRDDYSCEWDSPSFDYSLTVAGKKLIPSVVYSPLEGQHFLVTAALGEYYLAHIKSSAIDIYPVLLTTTAQQILSSIPAGRLTDHTFVARVETYALSQATFGAMLQSVAISWPAGNPLYYGWAASWDGLTLKIVLHIEDVPNKQYLASLHTLSITPAIDGAGERRFTADISSGAASAWWPIASYIYQFNPMPIVSDTAVAFGHVGSPPYKGLGSAGYSSFDAPMVVYSAYDFVAGESKFFIARQTLAANVYTSGATIVQDQPMPIYASDEWVQRDRINIDYTGGFYGQTGVSVASESGATIVNFDGNIRSFSQSDQVNWVLNQTAVYEGFAHADISSGPAITSQVREAESNDHWRVWMSNNGYYYPSGSGYSSNTAGTISDGAGGTTSIYYGVKLYSATYDRRYGLRDNVQEISSVFVESLLGDCSAAMVGHAEYKGQASHSLSIEPNRVKGPWGFAVCTFYYHAVNGLTILNEVTGMIIARYVQWQFYPVSGVPLPGDAISLRQRVRLAKSVTDELYATDLASGASPPANWHFACSIATGELLGTQERCRSSLVTDGRTADISFGGAISFAHNFVADSAVGWA